MLDRGKVLSNVFVNIVPLLMKSVIQKLFEKEQEIDPFSPTTGGDNVTLSKWKFMAAH